MALTNAEKQENSRNKKVAAGWVRVELWIKPENKEKAKKKEQEWRK